MCLSPNTSPLPLPGFTMLHVYFHRCTMSFSTAAAHEDIACGKGTRETLRPYFADPCFAGSLTAASRNTTVSQLDLVAFSRRETEIPTALPPRPTTRCQSYDACMFPENIARRKCGSWSRPPRRQSNASAIRCHPRGDGEFSHAMLVRCSYRPACLRPEEFRFG